MEKRRDGRTRSVSGGPLALSQGRDVAACRRSLQMARKPFEHAPCRRPIPRAHAAERLGNGSFDCSATNTVDSRPSRREPKDSAPAIARIIGARQEPLVD